MTSGMKQQFSRRWFIAMLGATGAATRLYAAEPSKVFSVATANGRMSAISAWYAKGRKCGTVLFSHGAFSAPWKYEAIFAQWTDAGFDVFAPLHVDSTDHPDTRNYAGLTSWAARIEDMRSLANHLGQPHYVAAGHSYGALVALTLGGASPVVPKNIEPPLRDKRAKAVVAFSPPGAMPGLVDAAAYATLAVPALIQTGTLDVPPGAGPEGWQSHLLAYQAAADGGDRYALVLEEVDHYFGGMIGRPELPGPKQQVAFDSAVKISLDFMQAYALDHSRARRVLAARLADSGAIRLTQK